MAITVTSGSESVIITGVTANPVANRLFVYISRQLDTLSAALREKLDEIARKLAEKRGGLQPEYFWGIGGELLLP